MVRKIFLTGGSGYIGGAILEHLHEQGFDVAAPTRQELNVRYTDHVQHYLFGKQFDAMILAHGTYGNVGKMKDLHLSEWGEAIMTNVMSVMALIRYANVSGPIIIFGGARGGTIPLEERSSYAASKAAVNAMVITGAAEGLPIYGVAPGPMASTMNHWLLKSEVSEHVKKEMRESLRYSVGVEHVIAIISHILEGKLQPGKFYSAREWAKETVNA